MITHEHAPYAHDRSKHKPDQASVKNAYGRSGFVGFDRRVWSDFRHGGPHTTSFSIAYQVFAKTVLSDVRKTSVSGRVPTEARIHPFNT